MADNVPITAGSGTTIATDDVAGVHYQAVKVVDATLDSTNRLIIDSSGRISVVLAANSVASFPVDIIAQTLGAISVTQTRPSTAAVTSVAASATSVTLLALNTSRRDSSIYNDSSADLYIKLGTTASTTSFTVKLGAGEYYEVAFAYTGRIDGIWSSATGSARITELT